MSGHITRESTGADGGGSELWLVGINARAALAITAFVAALTQTRRLTAVRDVMWTLAVTGVSIMLLCPAAYFSRRRRLRGSRPRAGERTDSDAVPACPLRPMRLMMRLRWVRRPSLPTVYASRARTSRKVTAISAAASTRKMPASMPWKAQNLPAGW